MGNVEGAAQAIADALAPTQQSPSARWRWGTVVSVQDDGTITATVGGTTVSGIRASQQAMGAAAGDRVRICYIGTEAFADSLRASSKLIRLPSIEAGSLALGSPLTIANGGTGATTASGARVALNVPSVASQTNQLVNFSAGSGSTQVQAIYFNVTNSSSAYDGKRLALLIRQDGISLYNGTDNSTVWTTVVSTSSPTIANATATAFELRKAGSAVNLQISQLKVSASLADGSTVSLGSGIIPSDSRPARAIGIPLMANAAGKGAGCWLYITGAGTVTLYNRSGSALGTNTNLYGNATWVV